MWKACHNYLFSFNVYFGEQLLHAFEWDRDMHTEKHYESKLWENCCQPSVIYIQAFLI